MSESILLAYSNTEEDDSDSNSQIDVFRTVMDSLPIESILNVYQHVLQMSFNLSTLLSFIHIDGAWSSALETLISNNVLFKRWDDGYGIEGVDGLISFNTSQFNNLLSFFKKRNIRLKTLQFKTTVDDIEELAYLVRTNSFESIRVVVNFANIPNRVTKISHRFTSFVIQLSRRPDVNLKFHFYQYLLEASSFPLWPIMFRQVKSDATKAVMKIDDSFIKKVGFEFINNCTSLQVLRIHLAIFETPQVFFEPTSNSIKRLIINVNHCFYPYRLRFQIKTLFNLKYVELHNLHIFEDIFLEAANSITELVMTSCVFHTKPFTFPKNLQILFLEDCSPANYFGNLNLITSLNNLSVTGKRLLSSSVMKNLPPNLSNFQIGVNLGAILIRKNENLKFKEYTLLKQMEEPKHINVALLPCSLSVFNIIVTTDERESGHRVGFKKKLVELSLEFKTGSKHHYINSIKDGSIEFLLDKESLTVDLRKLKISSMKKVLFVTYYALTILTNDLAEALDLFEIEKKNPALPVKLSAPQSSKNSSESGLTSSSCHVTAC